MRQGVAFLATGTELVAGEVLNTNGAKMAEQIADTGICVYEHIVITDDERDITHALEELMGKYRVVIVSGGLGPTSDDRTRYAVAAATKHELVFHEGIWQELVARLNALNLEIPENNRQQAMLPKGAEVFANMRGTAAGVQIACGECDVFMLPGPPNECLPMFDKYVVNRVKDLCESRWKFHRRWLLLGVSEGAIASQCDPLLDEPDVEIGYRVEYPYLTVKLFATQKSSGEKIAKRLESILGPLSVGELPVLQALHQQLQKEGKFWAVDESATGGRLQAALMTPDLFGILDFASIGSDAAVNHISVSGLEDFWRGQSPDHFVLNIKLQRQGRESYESQHDVPNRGLRTLSYARELICWQWLKYIGS